jgi:hypothetical protein
MPRSCTANLPIMQFHDVRPFAASNTHQASSLHPHLQYMSTTAVTNFLSISIPLYSTHWCTSLLRISAPVPIHATITLAMTNPFLSIPHTLISSNTSRASRYRSAFR